MRGLDLSLRLGDHLGIGSRGNGVGFVDGRGLGFLRVRLWSGASQAKLIDALHHAVEFLLQAIVGADVQVAVQQSVESIIEVLLGGVGIAGLIVGQPGLYSFPPARSNQQRRLRRALRMRPPGVAPWPPPEKPLARAPNLRSPSGLTVPDWLAWNWLRQRRLRRNWLGSNSIVRWLAQVLNLCSGWLSTAQSAAAAALLASAQSGRKLRQEPQRVSRRSGLGDLQLAYSSTRCVLPPADSPVDSIKNRTHQ